MYNLILMYCHFSHWISIWE